MRLDGPGNGRRAPRRLTNAVGLVEIFMAVYSHFFQVGPVPALAEQLEAAAAGGTAGARLLVRAMSVRYRGPAQWSGSKKKFKSKFYWKIFLNPIQLDFDGHMSDVWLALPVTMAVRRRFKLGCPRSDIQKFIFDQNFEDRDLGHPNSRTGWRPSGWSSSCPVLPHKIIFLL